MSLTPDKIQAIRERIDVTQVIGTHVTLARQGTQWVGLCPFHPEKTPSFSVSAERGLYYCFGCHAGGDIFSFVQRHQGIDFPSAARYLADIAGVEVEPENPEVKARREMLDQIRQVNDHALIFFERTLWSRSPAGKRGRAYLTQRAIPEAFARQRRLGFGGDPDGLLSYLRTQGVVAEAASGAGLTNERGDRSLFDGRLVFPILEPNGRVAGFGGRRLQDDGSPKYINTRESPLFSKRKLLYGWYEAQEGMRRSRRVVIVEGYTDVLACHRAGVLDAIGVLGTAFTEDHARTCARLATEAVVFLDGDAAGQRAARQAVEKLLGAGMKTMLAALPAEDDPDSFAKNKGPAALVEVVQQARPAVESLMETAFPKPDMSIEDRVAAAQDMAPLLAALQSGLERDIYMARLAERVGVPVEQLRRHLLKDVQRNASSADGAITTRGQSQAATEAPAPVPAPVQPSPHTFELEMLRELLLYPELMPRLSELAEFAVTPQMGALLDELAKSDEPVMMVVQRHVFDARWIDKLSKVKPLRADESDDVAVRSQRTLDDVLLTLKRRHVETALRNVMVELKEIEAKGGDLTELMQRKRLLTQRKNELRLRTAPAVPPNVAY